MYLLLRRCGEHSPLLHQQSGEDLRVDQTEDNSPAKRSGGRGEDDSLLMEPTEGHRNVIPVAVLGFNVPQNIHYNSTFMFCLNGNYLPF